MLERATLELEARLALTQTDEKDRAQHNKEDVRKPDQQFRMNLRIVPEGIGDDHKKEIRNGDDKAQKKTDGGFPPMRRDAKRHANEGEGYAGKRKGKSFVQLSPAGTALSFVCAL